MNANESKAKLVQYLNFSDEKIAKLEIFVNEVLNYNKKYNLISKSTENDIWSRHVLDSAQLIKFIDHKKIIVWLI